jgi:hypothetical protein
VKALKKLQFESLKVEAEFFRRMNELEREYQMKYDPLFDKRRTILIGELEPTTEDCDWPEDLETGADGETKALVNNEGGHKETDKLISDGDKGANATDGTVKDTPAGIPDFWLTIFQNVPLLGENKEDCDDEVLRSLQDIKCQINPPDSRPGYFLEFYFAPNDFFTNSVLRKDYYVRFDPPSTDPFSFEGPEIVESKGCTINWKPGKNVTVKTVKKTMRHKNRGEKKTISKTVKTNSFFNFFDPPKGCIDNLPEEADDQDDDVEIELQADFELGQFFREQIIPRAVLFYTGEAVEDDDEYDTEGEAEEEDEEDEDEGHHGRSAHRQRGNSNSQQQECKQQ